MNEKQSSLYWRDQASPAIRWPAWAVCGIVLAAGWACQPDVVQAQQNVNGRLPVLQYAEPYLLLLRDPVVHRELKLTAAQQRQLQDWNDKTDLPLWTTRNQSAERGLEIARQLIVDSRAQMQSVLDDQQRTRLGQIELWVLGLKSLQRPAVVEQLKLSEKQQQQITDTLTKTQKALQSLQQQAQAGEPRAPLEKRNRELARDSQKEIQETLSADQLQQWKQLMGSPLPADQLGLVKFKTPDLTGEGPWINSVPLTWTHLRGKVVVVHFWTFGCINCIHNYPAYQHWLKDFAGKDVVLLGIHTPETPGEHQVETIRQRAQENQLNYPIVVDNDLKNWNAWGNSMWPTVYLVDRSGYVRAWWQGELNWEGQEGEKLFKQRIEELLAEETTPANRK